jgi:hypothetical protein
MLLLRHMPCNGNVRKNVGGDTLRNLDTEVTY